MTEAAHSKLFAPSSAHRWMHCTASSFAASVYKDEPGEAAMEGTAFHWLLETCLTDGSDPSIYLGRTLIVTQDQARREFVVSPDMVADARLVASAIREVALRPGISRVEVKVRLPQIDADIFGRTDVWAFGQDRWLSVMDAKYGRVDVSPERNEQLMVYALGIYREHIEPIAGDNVAGVNLMIAQPRSLVPGPRIKTWRCSLVDLLDFELSLRVAVHEVRNAPQFRAGDHCHYCPALGSCPPTKEAALKLGPILAAAELTALDASRILAAKDLLEKKIKDAKAVGKEALLHRQEVPGFRLGVSRKHRQFRDEELAKERLYGTYGVKALAVPTPSQAEKLGPDAKKIVDELSFTPPGEPDIVAANSTAPAYVAKSAEQMFG